ncbi:MAG: hypothetical protein K8T25_19735 [Planctomycetia bacterium]|nr:hypothetical protein [Planctomycetia bacterium]
MRPRLQFTLRRMFLTTFWAAATMMCAVFFERKGQNAGTSAFLFQLFIVAICATGTVVATGCLFGWRMKTIALVVAGVLVFLWSLYCLLVLLGFVGVMYS